jgi:hypothetical protein
MRFKKGNNESRFSGVKVKIFNVFIAQSFHFHSNNRHDARDFTTTIANEMHTLSHFNESHHAQNIGNQS